MAGDHWLAGVARVLRADTNDLRELARIGGVDPRTAYVGTRLDGADLRGQDLRGMVFTDLDMARVRHDAGTQVDPEQVVASSPRRPTIVVATPRLDLSTVKRALASLDPVIIDPRETSALLLHIQDWEDPTIILAFDEDLRAAEDLFAVVEDQQLLDAVIIVQGRSPDDWFQRWRHIAGGRRVYYTHDQSVARNGHRLGFARDTRHLAELLSLNWRRLQQHLPRQATFVRARGSDPRPLLDGGAQVFDRLYRMDLYDEDLMLVGAIYHGTPREWETVGTLLNFDRHEHLDLPTDEFCAFIKVDNEPPYVLGLRRQQKRYMPKLAESLDQLSGKPERARWRDLFEGEATPMGLALRDGAFKFAPRSAPPIKYREIDRFDFSYVETVVLHEHADVGWVVDRLVTAGELWATARDILGLDGPDDFTTWGLIASQLRRIVPQNGGRSRQAYLGLVCREAVRRYFSDPSLMEAHLKDAIDIRIEGFAADLGRARFTAYLVPRGGTRAQARAVFDIEIDPSGPRVVRVHN